MADLTKDEIKVLNAVDMFASRRLGLVSSMRPIWDDLLRRGYIEARTTFVLSEKGQQVVNERDMSDEPQ